MTKRLIWSALLMAVTAWLSPAQQTKNVSIPGDAYTAYNIPSGGAELRLDINAKDNVCIDDSEILLKDTLDAVQWSYQDKDSSSKCHVYKIGTVFSAREYLHVFGHYHYTNGVGGGGTHPTFNAKVAAPDVDPEYLNEDQEESVGIWIGKSGVRKPITIREVNCKGPGNQQILTWSSGKLSLWTASSGGSMLSGSSKYLSASQEYTYYVQGDMASGSIRDSEINTAYTAGGNTAYDKLKITVVGASFTPFSIIPVNTTQDVSVTLSPNPPGTNITLQLSCLDGSGSAVFAPDGTTSTNITQTTTVKIKGVTASSVASNMILKAMLGNDMFASNKFSVLNLDLKVSHPQNPGPTGSAAKYNNTPNTGSADNLFSTWLNEQFRVNVNIEPAALANNLPAGFITWTAAGFTIPDNTTEYTFSWSSTSDKEITAQIPSCEITKNIRVDVPGVGILSQTAAAALVGAPSLFVLAYAQEAIDYSNNNFPVGPQRDAFRHAYWMSLSVSQLGVAQWEALLISTGHEHDNRDEDHQQAFNSTMDLHNNSIGSGITHTTLLGTPDRTPIQNDITQQYTNGGLWIWTGGEAQENSEGILVKSNGSKIYSD